MSAVSEAVAPPPAGIAELDRDGFVILRQVAAPTTIADVARDLSADYAATPFCQGGFYGHRTKRFGRLLLRSPAVAELVMAPPILALAEAMLKPWCDTLQLNLTQATEIHPGAPAQFPHRDQDMWRGETGSTEYLINVMWPLTPFTADNGATCLWPNSHRDYGVNPDASRPISALCDPGDALVFLGSTLHGAGANRASAPRQGLIISYCLGWLKPYENQWLAYPPAVARRFPPELAALVGYRQHRPNLGNFEGQCPSVLLGGEIAAHLGAVDALRPDQAALLAAFMSAQGAGEGSTMPA